MMLSGSISTKINKAAARSVVQVSLGLRNRILFTDFECNKSMLLTSKGTSTTLNTTKLS